MFLESKKNSDQNYPGLVNSSIYDSDTSENHNISYDMLMVNGPSENIFHTLACQAEIHLNVKMSAMECKDQIIAYMKEQEEEKIPNTLNESLDLETIEAVLRATSALYKCFTTMKQVHNSMLLKTPRKLLKARSSFYEFSVMKSFPLTR